MNRIKLFFLRFHDSNVLSKRTKIILCLWPFMVCLSVYCASAYRNFLQKEYELAKFYFNSEKYQEASELYTKIYFFADSDHLASIASDRAVKKRVYENAVEAYESDNYEEALVQLDFIKYYGDSGVLMKKITYDYAKECLANDELIEARKLFLQIEDYADSADYAAKIDIKLAAPTASSAYKKAEDYLGKGKYEKALEIYSDLGNYNDCQEKKKICEKLCMPRITRRNK